MNGYKTYLVAAAIAGLAAVHYLGYINDQLYQTLVGVFGAGGLAALRAGVAAK
jgi:hypothetical protein